MKSKIQDVYTHAVTVNTGTVTVILFSVNSVMWNFADIQYWRCVLKKAYTCPDNDIKFYLYRQ